MTERARSLEELVPEPRGAVELSVDEGGIRCDWRSRHAYVPLDAIHDVNVRDTIFHNARLVLAGHHGDTIELQVSNASPVTVQRVLLLALEERRYAKTGASPAFLLERQRGEEGDRSWDAWLEDLTLRATGAYREAALDPDALLALLSDPHQDVESRAAAAYVLLVGGSEEHLVQMIRVFITHALPPIVIALAHAAPGGDLLVTEELFREVLPYLNEAAAEALQGRTKARARDEKHTQVLSRALHRAKEEAAELARSEQDSASQGSKWRRLHSVSAGADTRWIGKTWAL